MREQPRTRSNAVAVRGKALVGEVREKAGELVKSARSEAGNLQATLADRLDAGAEAVRSRAASSSDVEAADTDRAGRTTQAGVAVADGMERSAMWLRETDLTDVGTLVRRELRTRPGRTALIALGIGILIGRASRR